MKSIALLIATGCMGGLLISAFYKVAKTRWPEHYFTTSEVLDKSISSSWLRYAAFRATPPYTLGTLTTAAAIRYGVSIGWTLVICGTVHLATSVGFAVIEGIRTSSVKKRLVIAHLGVVALTALSLWLAWLTAHWWFPLMPGPEKYVEVALTGIIVALAIHYLQQATQQSVDVERLVADFKERVSPEIVKRLAEACARHRVDYDLAYTILITEATERPQWFRLIERLGGTIGLAATYGVMQSSNDRRTTDEKSIDCAMASLADAVIPRKNGFHRQVDLDYHLERYNNGEAFRELATSVFTTLANGYAGLCPVTGSDGTPAIRVSKPRREGALWKLAGDASDEVAKVAILDDETGTPLTATDTMREPQYPRRKWEVEIPISQEFVTVLGLGEGVTGMTASPDIGKVRVYLSN